MTNDDSLDSTYTFFWFGCLLKMLFIKDRGFMKLLNLIPGVIKCILLLQALLGLNMAPYRDRSPTFYL